MNWDLVLGALIGISSSVITIAGTLLINKQKHKQEMAKNLQTIVLDNSFKEYELSTKMGIDFQKSGESVTFYPYDMFLVTYSKIAEYLAIEKQTNKDLDELIEEMKRIKEVYDKSQ